MLLENDFDKFKLLELLKVSHPNPSFWHGQVKRAASRMLKEYGYQWTFISLEHSIEEKKRLKGLEKSLRRTIFLASRLIESPRLTARSLAAEIKLLTDPALPK